MSKNITRQEKYYEKMSKYKFLRRCFWVHEDDLESAKQYFAKKRKDKFRELLSETTETESST